MELDWLMAEITPGRRKLATAFQFSFEFGYALFERSNRNFHFGGGVSRRDVLRTVPIEGNNLNEEQPFHKALNFRLGKLRGEFGMLSRIFDAGMQPVSLTVAM